MRALRVGCSLLSVLAGFAPFARAAEADAVLKLGDSFAGVISSVSDVDHVTFAGIAGERVTLILQRSKSKLTPELELFDGMGVLIAAAAGPTKATLADFVLPATGDYGIYISGGGSVGGYKLTTKAVLAAESLAPPFDFQPGSPDQFVVQVDALAGSTLTCTAKPLAGSPALPGTPTLLGPGGAIDVAPFLTLAGSTLTLKKVPLAAHGAYTLAIPNAGATGELDVKTTVAPPKSKAKLVEPPSEALGLLYGGALNTTSSSKKFPLAGNVVLLDSGAPPKALQWQRSGAGKPTKGGLKIGATGAFKGSVSLAAGDNVIDLLDPLGAVLETIAVTYNPGVKIPGLLEVLPDVVYVGQSKTLTARIALTGVKVGGGVELAATAGGSETVLTTMTDDGNLANGDEIDGDGIYTGTVPFLAATPGPIGLRAVIHLKNGKTARSEIFRLIAAEPLSDADLNEILAEQDSMETLLAQGVATDTLPAKIAAIEAQLALDPDVADFGRSDGEKGLWIVYTTGVAGVVYAPESLEKSGSAPTALAPRARDRRAPDTGPGLPPYSSFLAEPPVDAGSDSGSGLVTFAAAPPKNEVKSNKVFAIAAQFFDWGNNDDIPEMVTKLQNNGCFDVTYKTYNSKGSGSVEDFKGLGSYGVVLISSHGDSFYNGLLTLWKDKFKWNGPFGQVVLHSNMQVTTANKVTYQDDLQAGRLVLWGKNYGILPSFISRYSGKFPNSLIYMSICRGTWNGTMANAFTGAGAGSYLGYSDYVAVSFCKSHGPPLLDTLLLPDKTLADAFTPGQVETDADPAEFILYGAEDLALSSGQLQDGSFESGSIAQAWSPSGDARIIGGLGPYGPSQGSRIGIISTGLGFTVSSGSIAQNFCLPAGTSTLEFDWAFLSEEFLEYCNDIYQDTFTVRISEVGNPGNTAVLFNTFVDDLCDEVSAESVSFDQGDVYGTGWRSKKAEIPASLAGKKVRLSFECSDVGDSIYDTAILIDDIKVKTVNP